MEYKDIFEAANQLIDMLSFSISDDLIEYITNEVSNNGFCSEESYKEFLKEKY